jgi:hypothetical protein
MKHLNELMDEATIVVDKFIDSDPEQARWHARICESFEGTRVSIVASPWDQALANRVPLDLGAVNGATLDAKLAMAEVVLRGVDRANRKRLGLPEEPEHTGDGQRNLDEPPRWHSRPLPPSTGQEAPIAPNGPRQPAAASPPAVGPPAASPAAGSFDAASPAAAGPAAGSFDDGSLGADGPAAGSLDADDEEPYVRIIPARPKSEQHTD